MLERCFLSQKLVTSPCLTEYKSGLETGWGFFNTDLKVAVRCGVFFI